jgi:DNA-binding winged helix-turn-helix (wHTH) protein
LLDASTALMRGDPDSAVTAWLENVCRDLNWAIGEVWSYSGRFFRLEYTWFHPLSPELAEFSALSKRLNPPFERTTLGVAYQSDKPIYIPNFPEHSRYRGPIAGQFGLQACLAMPIRTIGETIYGLVLLDYQPRDEIDSMITAMQVACDELGLFLSLQQVERRNASGAPMRILMERVTQDLAFDPVNRTLHGPNGTMRLSGIEWDVFSYLAQNRGNVVSHSDLMQTIWGVNDNNSRNSLYEIMSRLRSHLRSIGVDRSTLHVVPKQGYALHFDPAEDLPESAIY